MWGTPSRSRAIVASSGSAAAAAGSASAMPAITATQTPRKPMARTYCAPAEDAPEPATIAASVRTGLIHPAGARVRDPDRRGLQLVRRPLPDHLPAVRPLPDGPRQLERRRLRDRGRRGAAVLLPDRPARARARLRRPAAGARDLEH